FPGLGLPRADREPRLEEAVNATTGLMRMQGRVAVGDQAGRRDRLLAHATIAGDAHERAPGERHVVRHAHAGLRAGTRPVIPGNHAQRLPWTRDLDLLVDAPPVGAGHAGTGHLRRTGVRGRERRTTASRALLLVLHRAVAIPGAGQLAGRALDRRMRIELHRRIARPGRRRPRGLVAETDIQLHQPSALGNL